MLLKSDMLHQSDMLPKSDMLHKLVMLLPKLAMLLKFSKLVLLPKLAMLLKFNKLVMLPKFNTPQQFKHQSNKALLSKVKAESNMFHMKKQSLNMKKLDKEFKSQEKDSSLITMQLNTKPNMFLKYSKITIPSTSQLTESKKELNTIQLKDKLEFKHQSNKLLSNKLLSNPLYNLQFSQLFTKLHLTQLTLVMEALPNQLVMVLMVLDTLLLMVLDMLQLLLVLDTLQLMVLDTQLMVLDMVQANNTEVLL